MIRLPKAADERPPLGKVILIPDPTDETKSVWVEVIPINRAIRRRARRAAFRHLEGRDLKALEQEDLEDFGEAFSYELLRLVIVAWGGVLEPEGGDDAPVAEITPSHDVRMRTSTKADRPTGSIDDFLGMEAVFETADRLVVMPFVERDKEKNALSASPSGTGEAATQAKTIAGSPATRKTASAAKSARTD